MDLFFLNASDGLGISCAYFPCPHPKATIQIIPGAKDHKERYYDFASFLNERGFAVILADNRGHGASVNATYPLGYMDNLPLMVDDLYHVSEWAKAKAPGVPLGLFGHSFGSLLARLYLQKHDQAISKLAMSGTVCPTGAASLGVALAQKTVEKKGKRNEKTALARLGNGGSLNWINSDRTKVAEFRKDPLSGGYTYANESVLTIVESVKAIRQISDYPCQNPALLILSVTGELDPFTGGKAGLKETKKILAQEGYDHFESIVYPHFKHEVVNCAHNEKILSDLLAFFER
jgi:alpha-beta hydrolase superfamily lysophospholipase